MEKIEEITNKLFSVNYAIDFENDNIYDDYILLADELINSNAWSNIYDCWYEYLINKCNDEEDVLNFANLFWCYEGYKHSIYNAIEFCAFFYANINFKIHPEADYLIDGMTKEILLNSGVYTQNILYEYVPLNDPVMKEAIKVWKETKYGLR